MVFRLQIRVYCLVLYSDVLLEEREGQQCQSWVFTFWDFSAAPLSRAAISTKIKDPNGAGPGGDERCRDGTLLWISNAVHVSKVMTDSQALLLRAAWAVKVSYSLSLSSKEETPWPLHSITEKDIQRKVTQRKYSKFEHLYLLWLSQWTDRINSKQQ